jgi:hypothetical protein
MSLMAFCVSIPLLNIKIYYLYAIIFFVICLSNGHLQNICTTLIIKKYSPYKRAAVYVFAYFFTQFGKFLFACLIYKFNDIIINGNLIVTVIPILIMISLQIICNLLLLSKMKKKHLLKKSEKELKEEINNSDNKNISFTNLIHINLPHNLNTISNPQNNFNILPTFYNPMVELMKNYHNHMFHLIFLNMSLGIQFFSMINVFPL